MKGKTIIAVDPGVHGGLAWKFGKEALGVRPIPEHRSDLIALLRQLVGKDPENCVAYVEQVAAYIPDSGASMMFEFGVQSERPTCILECLNVRIVMMPPKRWQKELGLERDKRAPVPKPPDHLDKFNKTQWNREHAEEIKGIKSQNSKAQRDWKKFLRDEAQRRFPTMRGITLGTCDALLILDAGSKLEGELLF